MKKFRIIRSNIFGDPNIGVYGFATDKYCILGIEDIKNINKIIETLNVPIKIFQIGNTNFPGIFSVGNSNGILVSQIIQNYELKNIKKEMKEQVIEVLKTKYTAIGNLILCNDKGAYVSEKLKRYKTKILDVLDCEVVFGNIANLEITGSAGIATNKGCLLHPDAKEDEIKNIENVLKVSVDVGTVNHGSPFVKSGIIANSYGVFVSENSTGPELGRISEVFGGIDNE
ncbi:MAG: translation initiation factor IF-6 [Candidatus Aenigmarchaeota archaeon]|nr:translation initiation factor IF-6 [Candidatus Aenigmarchaeota archaeon]